MTAFDPTLAARIAATGVPLTADVVANSDERPPKEGSREWLEQLPADARWAHTEVLAIYGDLVVNPSYQVAIYHLRYAVDEVKRLRAELADFSGRVNELESRLCECEPIREHRNFRHPAFYQHAADCPASGGETG